MEFCSLETTKVFVISPCLRKRSIMGHVFWYCANDMVSRTLRCGIVLRPLFHCFAFHLLLRITLFSPVFDILPCVIHLLCVMLFSFFNCCSLFLVLFLGKPTTYILATICVRYRNSPRLEREFRFCALLFIFCPFRIPILRIFTRIELITTTIPSYIFHQSDNPFASTSSFRYPLSCFSGNESHDEIGRVEPTLLSYAFPWSIFSLFSSLSLCFVPLFALFGHVKLNVCTDECKCGCPYT